MLQSAWSEYPYSRDEYGSDEAPDERTELWVSGIDATFEQCAGWAAAWLQRQLSRRIVRREWDRPAAGLSVLVPSGQDAGPVAAEWVIESPDEVFDSRGGFTWWWLMRRPPSRVVVERPGAGAQD